MEAFEINMQLQPGDDDLSSSSSNDAVEDDGTPVLDEQDLEENDLDVEEADQIVWDEPKESGK
jgi:hypothetical protein